MFRSIRIYLLAAGICLAATYQVRAQEQFVEPHSKKAFPATKVLKVQGKPHTLQVTGGAEVVRTRGTKTTSLFTLAHYAEKVTSADEVKAVDEMMKAGAMKAMVISFNLTIPRGKMGNWFKRNLVRKSDPDEVSKRQKSIDAFTAAFARTFKKDTQVTIAWLPDGKTLISAAGQKDVVVADPQFAPFFWKFWFSESSPITRTDLVSYYFRKK